MSVFLFFFGVHASPTLLKILGAIPISSSVSKKKKKKKRKEERKARAFSLVGVTLSRSACLLCLCETSLLLTKWQEEAAQLSRPRLEGQVCCLLEPERGISTHRGMCSLIHHALGGVGGGAGGVMTDLATGEDNLPATFDIYLTLEREKR